jgi:lipopolysaccharide/colanic/teichoic acid biosynthesis glycosyltransferase
VPEQTAIQSSSNQHSFYFTLKRLMDLALVIPALVLLSPLLLVIAVLIKVDSTGPVLFVQERVGSRRRTEDGKTLWEIRNFQFYKFRSMFHDADQSVHRAYIQAFVTGNVQPSEVSGAEFKLTADPRVTRVGKFLRRASLDELPQLINVLKGEMSLVGPRPVPVYEAAAYLPHHYQRLAALPGLTGFWQVKGRGRVTFEEMIQLDLEYIQNRSCWLDLKLILLTIPAILSAQGAM